ncbi:MAG: immunoglobulin domain-containing protein [Verrucomicrobia bacterium]|nr:immunoglobulin domain-containing protein [Verrucomicrobiota bacterium]MCH8525803.1 immunoglobulin domain-containing protein [Kiritimatiellia bacterium]
MHPRLHFVNLILFLSAALNAVAQSPLTFDPNNPPTQLTVPTEVYHEYTGTNSWRLGPKTMMVFRVYPSDRDPWTNYKSDEALLSELMTMSENYYRGSYHQTWFGPKRRNGMDIPVLVVTPPMQLPGTYEQYRNNFGLLQSHSVAAARELGPEWNNGGMYDPVHYDRWVSMSNANMVGSAGRAYVNGKFSWVGSSLSGTIAVHELGHNWGVFHANSWYAPDGVDPEVHPRSPLRVNGEYQDGWCVMGGGNPGLMFNPLFRYRLGFLTRDRNEVKDITSSGTYRIYDYQHHDRRQTESLVRVLNIPITSYTAWNNVFLGFGHRSGTDGGWSRTDYNRNAVTVHSMMSSGSNRLDTTPNSLPGNADRDDSSIKIGRTYSEGPNENGTQMFGGFHVTPVLRGSSEVNGQTHEWIEVVINYGNDITNNQPPAATFSHTVLNGAQPGVPFEITVNATDPDGDDLAFDWNFGDNTYNIVNSATQVKTWSEPGFYLVEVTVSDMKGGLTDAGVWVNVGDVPYRAPEAPAATLDGLHYTYYEGSFQLLPDFDTLFPVAEGTVDTFSLSPAQRNTNFALVYTGYLDVAGTDVYTFSIDAKDGVRFWIGDNLVIENDGVKSTSGVTTGNIALQAGLHEVRLEYFHRTGSEKLEVSWSTLDSPLTPLTASDLRQRDWQTNTPPAVSILNPLEGETFLVGADILLTAEASDEDGIAEVRFFANGNFLGAVSENPYTTLWENVSVGTQHITALAVDNTGRTQLSNVRTITVESPPPTRSVGINFAGTDSFAFPHAPTVVGFADRIGAVYAEPYWNNFTKAEDDANDGVYLNLIDNDGYPTPVRVEWQGHTESNVGKSATDTSTGNGRMMHGYVRFNNNNQDGPWLTAREIPYPQYDVYVYFDYVNDASQDANPQQFRITTTDGANDLVPPRYGQNSLDHNNGLGDYPNYETWVGFKESTALSATAPADERLGNYVVFRNITDSEFRVVVNAGSGANSGRRFMNGIQIVEVEATKPSIRVTAPEAGWHLSPEQPTASYTLRLSVAPDAPVTLVPVTTGNLVALTSEIVFTPSNWQEPQTVVLYADTSAGGTPTLSHTVTGDGRYDGVTVAPVSVTIEAGSQTSPDPLNQAPFFTSLPEVEVLTGAEYIYFVTAEDPEGDIIRFNAVDLPGWLSLQDHGDGTATLSGTAPHSGLSSVPVLIKASDPFNSTLQRFDITYTRRPAIAVNSPRNAAVSLPHLDLDLHPLVEVEGFGHPVTLAWSQISGPGDAVFDDPASLSPAVSFPEPGRYTLLLSADNGKGVSEKRIEVFAAASGGEVLDDGLTGYWRMNDPVGSSQLSDASGNEKHAAITDNGNFQLGVSGHDATAVRLGGNGNYATAPMGMPGQMTVSLWMLADASPAQRNGTLFSFIDGNGNLRGHLRMQTNDTRLHFLSNHVNSTGHWRFEKDIPSGAWMHVVLAYDNSSNQNHPDLWINGEWVERTQITAPGDFRATASLRIGSGTSSNTSWNGRIDEMRIYNRTVPAADIALLGYPGPVNLAPDIQVTDQGTGPGQTIQLGASVSDDGLPNPPGEVEVLWVQEGGPDDAEIGLDSFADTSFTAGPFPAIYELRLFADDGGALVSRTMRVQSEGGAPQAPEITQQPAALTVTELEPAGFSVSVNANPAPEFQWRKDGVDIPNANSATFQIGSATLADAGDYSVFIWNDEGDITSAAATLTVNPIPPEAPVITRQPQSQSALVTQSVTFEVEAGGHPAPTFQWRKNGTDLENETGSSLTLTNLGLSDSGNYDVVVANSEDTLISDTATLTVAEGPTPPVITLHPQPQSATEGDTILFSVEATGNPAPAYQWRFNGTPIAGAENASFELVTVTLADEGNYDVVVSNSEDTVTSDTVFLSVSPMPAPPVILSQPQDVEVTAGENAAFTVAAEGYPAPAYQWYFNGNPINGETGTTLTISGTVLIDAGEYTVQVSNSEGSVLSIPATLTIVPPPAEGSIALGDAYLIYGGSFTLAGEADNGFDFTNTANYQGILFNLAQTADLQEIGDYVELTFDVLSFSSGNNNPWAYRFGLFDHSGSPATENNQTSVTDSWTGMLAWYKTTNSNTNQNNNAMFQQNSGTAGLLGVDNMGGGFGSSPGSLGGGISKIGSNYNTTFRNNDTTFTVTFRIERTDTGLDITTLQWSNSGETITRSLAHASVSSYAFNALGFAHNGDFSVRNIEVMTNTLAQPGEPPAAPSGLQILSGATAPVSLSWTDNSDNELGFQLERSPAGADTFSVLASLDTETTSYLDETASPGQHYDYRVRAWNNNGFSDYSGVVTFTPEEESTPYQDWLAENGLEEEEDVLVDGQTYTPEQLYTMNAQKDAHGNWQGLLRAESFVSDGNGGMSLGFSARADRRYVLQSAETLAEPVWIDVADAEIITTEAGSRAFQLDTPAQGQRFYRIRVDLPE